MCIMESEQLTKNHTKDTIRQRCAHKLTKCDFIRLSSKESLSVLIARNHFEEKNIFECCIFERKSEVGKSCDDHCASGFPAV